jgi:hypothetical protein
LTVLAESALRDLLIDPCLLQRVQFAIRREAFECRDFTSNRGHRQDAGANRRTVDDYCAGAALAKPAAKPRALQTEVIPEDIEQWGRGFNVHRVRTAVDLKDDTAHSEFSFPISAVRRCQLPILSTLDTKSVETDPFRSALDEAGVFRWK